MGHKYRKRHHYSGKEMSLEIALHLHRIAILIRFSLVSYDSEAHTARLKTAARPFQNLPLMFQLFQKEALRASRPTPSACFQWVLIFSVSILTSIQLKHFTS